MAFKTFAPGVLTSSDVNTFLMRQSVITCTAATRPASPNEGMTIYETDTDAYAVYSGTDWIYQGHYQSFTPTITGITPGNGTVTTSYATVGKLTHYRGVFSVGSTTAYAASGSFTATLPVTPETSPSIVLNFGGGTFFDTSVSLFVPAFVAITSGPLLQIDFLSNPTGTQVAVTNFNTSAVPTPTALGAGDQFRWSIVYEAV